jgi:hypothetical protein
MPLLRTIPNSGADLLCLLVSSVLYFFFTHPFFLDIELKSNLCLDMLAIEKIRKFKFDQLQNSGLVVSKVVG